MTDEDKGYKCTTDLHVLGLDVSAGSLVFYLVTAATILSAVRAADRRRGRRPQRAASRGCSAASPGPAALMAALMFFVAGANWQLGAVLLLFATLFLGASLVVYDSLLVEIADPDERDRVSSRGWALGYLGGGLLLALNFVLLTVMSDNTELAVRISLLTAGIWWAVFTIIPVRGIRSRPPVEPGRRESGGLVQASFGQLWRTLKDLRRYPVTLTFLVAYLFYNDGIQTVIYAASVYGEKELGFEKSTVLLAFLVVQFVGIGGRARCSAGSPRVARRLPGDPRRAVRLAGRRDRRLADPERATSRCSCCSPSAIGVVLGGTQALSRSFYSQLIPRGREAEYFSLYQACERGTSWIGTLIFGLVHQLTDSYRPALLALMVLFVLGIVAPDRGSTRAAASRRPATRCPRVV